MSNQETINVQVNTKDLERATKILSNLGLDLDIAINIFIKEIIKTKSIPFDTSDFEPSEDLKEALAEVDEMINNPEKYPRFNNWDDLKDSLLSDDQL